MIAVDLPGALMTTSSFNSIVNSCLFCRSVSPSVTRCYKERSCSLVSLSRSFKERHVFTFFSSNLKGHGHSKFEWDEQNREDKELIDIMLDLVNVFIDSTPLAGKAFQ